MNYENSLNKVYHLTTPHICYSTALRNLNVQLYNFTAVLVGVIVVYMFKMLNEYVFPFNIKTK